MKTQITEVTNRVNSLKTRLKSLRSTLIKVRYQMGLYIYGKLCP